MKQNYTVLLTTSGLGERLGELTKYTNKSLISLGGKPIISHIIDMYPKNTKFVITTGYFGNHIKQFLKLSYPKHLFEFVDVEKFSGQGSSLGYSMLQAERKMQQPFIFHASDTIITTRPPYPVKNWIGGFKGTNSSQYRAFNVLGNSVQIIKEKGAISFDYLHIGLVGIYDYKKFWDTLHNLYKRNKNNSELADVHVLNAMISQGTNFTFETVTEWYDTGNTESLQLAKIKFPEPYTTLQKMKESIFFIDENVIKFYFDANIVKQRVKRTEVLKGVVPKIIKSTNNFYSYKKIKGNLYSNIANPHNFSHFLTWSKKNLWKKTNEVSEKKFKDICYDFYYTKSLDRIQKFFNKELLEDSENIINDEKVPSIKNLFTMIDFNWLTTTGQRTFHGDFILDNIIASEQKFYLVDWRGDFGGLIKSGDIYYDLAKLNHNLTVNHQIVNDNLFAIKVTNHSVTCDILRKENLVQCQKILFNFIKNEGFDEKKIKILTGIIWLNMSPLHHHPFDQFLFYFGKLQLWKTLNEKN